MRLKILIAALIVLAAGQAHAATQRFTATLTPAAETPANKSQGRGRLVATLDTVMRTLNYEAVYYGLDGAVTSAHFHGPGVVGTNAPPVVSPPADLIVGSSIRSTASLTDPQIADLQAGNWYFDVHTTAHPGGEIRGRVGPSP